MDQQETSSYGDCDHKVDQQEKTPLHMVIVIIPHSLLVPCMKLRTWGCAKAMSPSKLLFFFYVIFTHLLVLSVSQSKQLCHSCPESYVRTNQTSVTLSPLSFSITKSATDSTMPRMAKTPAKLLLDVIYMNLNVIFILIVEVGKTTMIRGFFARLTWNWYFWRKWWSWLENL